MERLMIDFSQAAMTKQNGINGINVNTNKERVYNFPLKRTDLQEKERPEAPGLSFEDILKESVKKVNSLQLEAEKKVRDLAIGDVEDISEVVLASSRADTAMRLLMELRNKFLDAYQALSRITG